LCVGKKDELIVADQAFAQLLPEYFWEPPACCPLPLLHGGLSPDPPRLVVLRGRARKRNVKA